MPSRDVKTFSIGFGERSFDESEHARARGRALRHRPPRGGLHARDDDRRPARRSSTSSTSRSRTRRSCRPTCSRGSRGESVTVALGGDGGDELLAGYPTFPAERVARLYAVPQAPRTSAWSRRSSTGCPVVDRELQPRLQAQAVPARGGGAARTSATRRGSARSRRPSRPRCSTGRPADPFAEQRRAFAAAPTTEPARAR